MVLGRSLVFLEMRVSLRCSRYDLANTRHANSICVLYKGELKLLKEDLIRFTTCWCFVNPPQIGDRIILRVPRVMNMSEVAIAW